MSFRNSYAEYMRNKRKLIKGSLPHIQCGFNSVGWSGEDDDDCYYSFDEKVLCPSPPTQRDARVYL